MGMDIIFTIYFVFDENFSVGTIVELGWAINFKKEIDNKYTEEWYKEEN